MEWTNLILLGRHLSSIIRFFTLSFLLFLQSFHDFLSHLSDFAFKDWLKASHKCLEKWVIKDLIAQMIHIFQHWFCPFNISPRIFTRIPPQRFILQSHYLQNYLYFRCIKSLKLSFELFYRILLLNHLRAKLFKIKCHLFRFLHSAIFFTRIINGLHFPVFVIAINIIILLTQASHHTIVNQIFRLTYQRIHLIFFLFFSLNHFVIDSCFTLLPFLSFLLIQLH